MKKTTKSEITFDLVLALAQEVESYGNENYGEACGIEKVLCILGQYDAQLSPAVKRLGIVLGILE